MNIEKQRYLPFKAPIIENDLTPLHPRIREIKDSGYLVRTYNLGPDPKTARNLFNDHTTTIGRLRNFGSYRGIFLPKFSSVVGSADGKNPFFFIVIERIKGDNLEDVSLSNDEIPYAKRAFGDLILGLVDYSRDIFGSRGDYLSDQKLSQYVYDKSSRKIFFVDLGMESHRLPPTRGQHHENSHFFAQYMQEIYIMLEELEGKIGEPLVTPRVALGNFLQSIPQGTGGISYAQAILESVLQHKLQEM